MHRKQRKIVGISRKARISAGRIRSLDAVIVCACVFAVFLNGCMGQTNGSSTADDNAQPPPVTPSSGKHWSLTFAEEFQGADYDHAKLSPCFDWNYGDCTSSFNNGYEHYLPSQVVVSVDWQRSVGKPLLDTSLTEQLEVDYLRVWQQVQ